MQKDKDTSKKGVSLVYNIAYNLFLRDLFLDEKNPQAVHSRTEKTITRLSPEELSAGAINLIEAIDQDLSSNTVEAAEIRTTALALLIPIVEYGVQKEVKISTYKSSLIKAFRKEQDSFY